MRSSQSDGQPLKPSHLQSSLKPHSALLACSLNPGAVPSAVTFPFSMSAAHKAAPTVFVNANKILATGTNSSRTEAIPKLTHPYQRAYRFLRFRYGATDGDLPSVRRFVLLDMLLFLRIVPLLQLKIPRMSRRPGAPPLQHHKHDRPNNWYEVQR